jgi:hypothetical protein
MKHKHHIIPKHAGGSDDPSNIVELTIEEHAEAHRVLWEQHGRTGDFVAWKMLSGKNEEAELGRIELAKQGFNKFLHSESVNSWKKKISSSLMNKKQSPESNQKRSKSLKEGYASGKIKSWFCHADKSFFQQNYDAERLARGRRKSKKWKDSVTSESYREKKSKLDPRSRKLTINGVEYNSIRSAAKALNMPYSRLRGLLNGNNFFSLKDI